MVPVAPEVSVAVKVTVSPSQISVLSAARVTTGFSLTVIVTELEIVSQSPIAALTVAV